MRRVLLTLVDILLIALASVMPLFVRDNFDVALNSLVAAKVYIGVTLLVGIVVILASGLGRGFWRFTTLADMARIVVAAVVTVVASVVIVFWIDRLEGVSRSLPIMQAFLIFFLLAGARLVVRMVHFRTKRAEAGVASVFMGDVETVLVVGVNALTDLYLRSIEDLAVHRISVIGLIGQRDRQTGRLMRQYKVLGTVDKIRKILLDLEVHGVEVNRIVVTEPVSNLSEDVLRELADIESVFDVRLDFLGEQLGFDRPRQSLGKTNTQRAGRPVAPFSPHHEEAHNIASRRFYRAVKRLVDASVSLAMLLVLLPVILIVWGLVAVSIGAPVLFWQRRPGLGGKNFKLYKFRTMGAGHGPDGRKLSDAERMSVVGKFLRDTRLDELPQLFNILVGEMSFVGPRPLLPVDQPEFFVPRLTVRPGLTGWAQVNGGRLVSPEDKGALDLFYVRNMSLLLDIAVICKTVPMVLFREKSNDGAVRRAWEEVQQMKMEIRAANSTSPDKAFELESEMA